MPKANPETILLKGNAIFKEAEAGGTIVPGHLLRRSAANTVAVHNSAGTVAARLFARENEIAGDGIADAYASGEKVLIAAAFAGCEVLAILADGEVAAVGSFLESNGNGELRVVDADTSAATIKPGSIIAQALEAVDSLVDSSTTAVANRRIKIEIL